jgi:hypothetical protein
LSALGPNLTPKQLAAVEIFLYQVLMITSAPTEVASIMNALSSLGFLPDASQFDQLLAHVSEVVESSKDPDLVRALASAITLMAPSLSSAQVQHANALVRALKTQFADALEPAANALSAKLRQLASGDQSSAPQTLLQKIAGSRWCVSGKSYTLQYVANTATWRDGSGSIDSEQVLSNGSLQAQTKTLRSIHPDGKSEPIGTMWTYRFAPPNKVNVTSTSGKRFTLFPC